MKKSQDTSQIPLERPVPKWFWWLIAICGPLLATSFAFFCFFVDDINGGPNEGSPYFWLFEAFILSIGIFLFRFGIRHLNGDRKFYPFPQSPRFPLSWVLVLNFLAVLSMVPFYWVSKGAQIAQIGVDVWGWCVLALIAAALLGIPMVLLAVLTNRRVVWPWAVVVLSVSVLPLVKLIFNNAQHLRGFVLP